MQQPYKMQAEEKAGDEGAIPEKHGFSLQVLLF